jgi:putative membrane protein
MTYLLLRVLLNIILMWLLAAFLPQYVAIEGGTVAYIAIGLVISLLNVIVRPLLSLITLPLWILSHLIAAILVNLVFLWVTEVVVRGLQSSSFSLDIHGGALGWLITAAAFGILNWALRHLIAERR